MNGIHTSVASRFTGASPVRFGWSTAQPPKFEIRLTRKDITPEGFATPALVARAKAKLTGENDETPRFCVLTNTKKLIGDNEAIKRFQKNLMLRLVENSQSVTDTATPNEDNYSHLRLDFAASKDRGFGTHQRPHWDTQELQLCSILYGPFKGFQGGYPQLFDVREPIRKADDPAAMREAIVATEGHINYVNTDNPLSAEHRVILDTLDYKNDRPLLIFNNHLPEGVAHGVSKPHHRRPGAVRNGYFYSPMPR